MPGSDGLEGGLEVGVWVGPIHLRRFDQRGDACPCPGALVMAGEQGVLAVQRQRADRVLDRLMPISA